MSAFRVTIGGTPITLRRRADAEFSVDLGHGLRPGGLHSGPSCSGCATAAGRPGQHDALEPVAGRLGRTAYRPPRRLGRPGRHQVAGVTERGRPRCCWPPSTPRRAGRPWSSAAPPTCSTRPGTPPTGSGSSTGRRPGRRVPSSTAATARPLERARDQRRAGDRLPGLPRRLADGRRRRPARRRRRGDQQDGPHDQRRHHPRDAGPGDRERGGKQLQIRDLGWRSPTETSRSSPRR